MDPAAAVLHYAQEIFEGLKAYKTGDGATLFRPQENARRFQQSAERLAMPVLPEKLFLEAVDQLVRIDRDWIPDGDGSLYIRPFMFANEIFLGVKPSSNYLFAVIASSVGSYFKSGADAVSVWVSQEYTRAAPGGTGAAKCGGNYAASLLAQAEATRHGCDQVVFLDAVERKWIEELGGMNVFFVFNDGSLCTPPLGGTILPGVTRSSLITLAKDKGIPVREERYSYDQWKADAAQRPAARGLRLRHRRGGDPDRHGSRARRRVQDRQRWLGCPHRRTEDGAGRHPALPCARPAQVDPPRLLEELAAVRHLLVRHDQHDGAIAVGEAQRQHLRHELADLARREVDHRSDLAADQAFRRVVHRELGRRFLEADLGPEIDLEPERWLARALQRLGGAHGADADVDLGEVVVGDGHGTSL